MSTTDDTTRTVHLAVYDGLADWETGYVAAGINSGDYQRSPGGLRIVTVGATPAVVTTIGGVRIVPDMVLGDLIPADSAMLVLPGADGWATGELDAFGGAAVAFAAAGVPVAAICGATFGLAAHGLLDDRAHTSNAPMFLEASGYAGAAYYRDELAVTDRGVITAGAIAPVEFAREVFAVLGAFEPAVLASWYKLFGKHDPVGYFELVGAAS